MSSCNRLSVAVAIVVGTLSLGCNAPASTRTPPLPNPNLLTRFANAPYFGPQFEVAERIVKAGDSHVLEDLAPWLSRDDRHARGNAAFVFAKFGDPRGLQTILAMLTDKTDRPIAQGIPGGNPTVRVQVQADRYYAAHLCGLLKDPRATEALLPLLDDADVNGKVAWALGEIGDQRAVQPLIHSLNDREADMRLAAIDALAKLNAREAVPQLRMLFDDNAMGRIGVRISVGDAARTLIETWEKGGPDFDRANAEMPRLKPEAFTDLPTAVRRDLEGRGCLVPQTYATSVPTNVAVGHFTSAATSDIAVLCSQERVSTIVVFHGGRTETVSEIARAPDADFLQVIVAGGVIGFSRRIDAWPPKYFEDHSRADGESMRTRPDHDGIREMFMGKASVVWYWSAGKWLKLQRPD